MWVKYIITICKTLLYQPKETKIVWLNAPWHPIVAIEWASLIWLTGNKQPLSTAFPAVLFSQVCSPDSLSGGFKRKTQNLNLIWIRYVNRNTICNLSCCVLVPTELGKAGLFREGGEGSNWSYVQKGERAQDRGLRTPWLGIFLFWLWSPVQIVCLISIKCPWLFIKVSLYFSCL